MFVRVGSQGVAANALEDAAGSVGEETDDAASRRVDLRIKRTHRTHLVTDLLDGDSAGNRNEQLLGAERVYVAHRFVEKSEKNVGLHMILQRHQVTFTARMITSHESTRSGMVLSTTIPTDLK